MKRVEIKGIEFDWIFTDKEGKSFLDELSATENMDIFKHDIIKDIILFQWSKIKPYIVYLQFAPFFFYFISFLIYTIWSMKEKQDEVEQGPRAASFVYQWVNLAFAILNLCFITFFLYVEAR
jgi:hypothetical protein